MPQPNIAVLVCLNTQDVLKWHRLGLEACDCQSFATYKAIVNSATIAKFWLITSYGDTSPQIGATDMLPIAQIHVMANASQIRMPDNGGSKRLTAVISPTLKGSKGRSRDVLLNVIC